MIKNPHAVELGKLGGYARAKKLSKKRRSEIARKAVLARIRKNNRIRLKIFLDTADEEAVS
jgi:hypothetical protein